jgi:hypothetical protein
MGERGDTVTPLAEIVYDILRQRTSLADPRITYAELAERVRDASDHFADINHRSRQLYAVLTEIGDECRRLKLPPLPTLVVRADTGRPGDAYYEGSRSSRVYRGEQVAAWRRDLEEVKGATYPSRY